jgi:hypothetical protein
MPPRQVSEIASGQQFSRSGGDSGKLADSQTRVFRVLMNSPNEALDIQQACGIYIGNNHPQNNNIWCTAFDAKYEGDSRLVVLCTFQYGSYPSSESSGGGEDPKSFSPDIRPPNVTTSTSTAELPVYEWRRVLQDLTVAEGKPIPAKNSAGDMYDGITTLTYISTIAVEQFVPDDPTKHITLVGTVNSKQLKLGSLVIEPRTLMFRGLTMKPTIESWGGEMYRGWMATYEFAYKPETWDLRIPQTGYNVKAFSVIGQGVDVYGQPLKHKDGKVLTPLALPDGVTIGEKVRAMVKVFEYENGGVSQLPSAQPVALNDNGHPLAESEEPLIKRYSVYETSDFAETLALRVG